MRIKSKKCKRKFGGLSGDIRSITRAPFHTYKNLKKAASFVIDKGEEVINTYKPIDAIRHLVRKINSENTYYGYNKISGWKRINKLYFLLKDNGMLNCGFNTSPYEICNNDELLSLLTQMSVITGADIKKLKSITGVKDTTKLESKYKNKLKLKEDELTNLESHTKRDDESIFESSADLVRILGKDHSSFGKRTKRTKRIKKFGSNRRNRFGKRFRSNRRRFGREGLPTWEFIKNSLDAVAMGRAC